MSKHATSHTRHCLAQDAGAAEVLFPGNTRSTCGNGRETHEACVDLQFPVNTQNVRFFVHRGVLPSGHDPRSITPAKPRTPNASRVEGIAPQMWCLRWSTLPLQVQGAFGLGKHYKAARLQRRASDMLERGFEWTLLHGEPQNPNAHRYPLMPPCCKFEVTGRDGRCGDGYSRCAPCPVLTCSCDH